MINSRCFVLLLDFLSMAASLGTTDFERKEALSFREQALQAFLAVRTFYCFDVSSSVLKQCSVKCS